MQRPLSDVSLVVMLSGPGKITVRLDIGMYIHTKRSRPAQLSAYHYMPILDLYFYHLMLLKYNSRSHMLLIYLLIVIGADNVVKFIFSSC